MICLSDFCGKKVVRPLLFGRDGRLEEERKGSGNPGELVIIILNYHSTVWFSPPTIVCSLLPVFSAYDHTGFLPYLLLHPIFIKQLFVWCKALDSLN